MLEPLKNYSKWQEAEIHTGQVVCVCVCIYLITWYQCVNWIWINNSLQLYNKLTRMTVSEDEVYRELARSMSGLWDHVVPLSTASPSSPCVSLRLFLFQIALILTHDNEGSDTDREAFSLTHTHSFPLYVSVSLFLWQSKPYATGHRVKEEVDVVVCVCVSVGCVLVYVWCGIKSQARGVLQGKECREGEGWTCQAWT